MSPETRLKISAKAKARWASLSPEQKLERGRAISEGWTSESRARVSKARREAGPRPVAVREKIRRTLLRVHADRSTILQAASVALKAPTPALEAVKPSRRLLASVCATCIGECRVAANSEGEPLEGGAPLSSYPEIALKLGVVRAVTCPTCKGTGR